MGYSTKRRLGCLEPILVDLERFDFGVEGGGRNAEFGGSTRGARDASLSVSQCCLDCFLLLYGRDPLEELADRITGVCSGGQPAFVDSEIFRVANDNRALDDVLQLANIAGPCVGLEAVECRLANRAN